MENEEKIRTLKVAVKAPVKREIDIIAASEQRPVYLVVEDMVRLYKAVTVKRPGSKSAKPVPVVEISEVVSAQ